MRRNLLSKCQYVTLLHLFAALLDDLTGLHVQVIKHVGVPVDEVRAAAIAMASTLVFPTEPPDEGEELSHDEED